MRKYSKFGIKGKGLAYEGRIKESDIIKAGELILRYDWDAVTEAQHDQNEKTKEELKNLGVTEISKNKTDSFGRIRIDIK